MMAKSLFDDFDNVSAKQWKQKIQFDLKGADYNEALVYKSYEGIDIKPFYSKEDVSRIDNTANHHAASWRNMHKIKVEEATSGNTKALTVIKKGVESIYFVIARESVAPQVLFESIPIDIPIYIETSFLSLTYIQKINNIAGNEGYTIYLLLDIIGNLTKTGNWYSNVKEDHQTLGTILKKCTHLKNIISIDIGLLQNSGATMVQQLAYGISHGNEYLNYLNVDKKVFFDDKNKPILVGNVVFKVAVGGNYFFEIAKLKALRLLWASLASEYEMLKKCRILACPSHRNKVVLDYNMNMLRTTTECMSAMLGGADIIYNVPYDIVYNKENDFSTRIAINQLLILKNESYFDLVSNPSSGSYYIESLTNQLAEKALSLFKNIEKSGGYLKQLKAGLIQRKIKDSATKEQALFDRENIVLVGVNKYKETEKIIPTVKKEVFVDKKSIKTLINPIVKRRLSEKIDKRMFKQHTN